MIGTLRADGLSTLIAVDPGGPLEESTPIINYTPQPIDEYMVIVNLPEDWEEVHNYIINENEIDGIPNRKINCLDIEKSSLRTSIYEMSVEEAELLKTHQKVETVELNPFKYPQPSSMDGRNRYDGNIVGVTRPFIQNSKLQESEVPPYVNGFRSNWGLFSNIRPESAPWRGVGITSYTTPAQTINANISLKYTRSGSGVDTITIDGGCAVLHPEFIAPDGSYRLKDVILDGPYMVDPDFFNADADNRLETVNIDGVDIGIRPVEWVARAWWAGTANRSATFSSLDTVSIPGTYTFEQAFSKNADDNPIVSGHGTAVASQIGGKTFGAAFESNPWTIRVMISSGGTTYGVLGGDSSIKVARIFHQAKKLISTNPNPTLINASLSGSSTTGNDNGTDYWTDYRGTIYGYTGNNSDNTIQSGSGTVGGYTYGVGSARNTTTYTWWDNNWTTDPDGTIYTTTYWSWGTSGRYLNQASSRNGLVEDAIDAGCIMVVSAGNTNQKLSDKNDADFNNKYYSGDPGEGGTTYDWLNRVGGWQQGFSGDHDAGKGSIRVGAIDCGVEPPSETQGSPKYSIRKVSYSANGPMVDIFAPAEQTLAAGYASYEEFTRADDSNFYDGYFGGTSSAAPITTSVIALYLEKNRGANQAAVRSWLTTTACKNNLLSDPYQSEGNAATDDLSNGYWSSSFSWSYDAPQLTSSEMFMSPPITYVSLNVRGNGNLRGAPNRVLYNPYAYAVESDVRLNIGESNQLTISGTDLTIKLI